MRRIAAIVLGIGLFAAPVMLTGCKEEKKEVTIETKGDGDVERSLDKAGDKVEKALDKAGDSTEKALDKAGDKTEEALDKADKKVDVDVKD